MKRFHVDGEDKHLSDEPTACCVPVTATGAEDCCN